MEENKVNEISGVDIKLIKERLNKGYSIEEAFTSLRKTFPEESKFTN